MRTPAIVCGGCVILGLAATAETPGNDLGSSLEGVLAEVEARVRGTFVGYEVKVVGESAVPGLFEVEGSGGRVAYFFPGNAEKEYATRKRQEPECHVGDTPCISSHQLHRRRNTSKSLQRWRSPLSIRSTTSGCSASNRRILRIRIHRGSADYRMARQ